MTKSSKASRINEKTTNALLARGLSKESAETLQRAGYNLGTLQQLSPDALRGLGITDSQIKVIQEDRPPIPDDTLHRVLHQSRQVCCVCREHDKGIIVHHIEEFSTSRSHDEDNLIVLCLHHHDLAHTRKELSQNLTPAVLRSHRDEWYKFVSKKDAEVALGQTLSFSGATWDYFNHQRLLEVAMALKIDLATIPSFIESRDLSLLDSNGMPIIMTTHQNRHYMYEGGLVHVDWKPIYSLYSDLVKVVMERSDWVDLDQNWNRTRLTALLRDGQLAFSKSAFYFKSDIEKSSGPHQRRYAKSERRGIRLEFQFNAWETTSFSAYGHLSGHTVISCLCQVRSLNRAQDGVLCIDARVLAMGTGFGPERHYSLAQFEGTSTCDDMP